MITTILVFIFVLPFTFAELRVGFYTSTCPRAERIVREVVESHFSKDESIVGGLLRLHFHDCFVRVRPNYIFSLHILLNRTCFYWWNHELGYNFFVFDVMSQPCFHPLGLWNWNLKFQSEKVLNSHISCDKFLMMWVMSPWLQLGFDHPVPFIRSFSW